ncbi:MAG: hypothetical protein R3211_04475 [Balneolaceae bacterium]|nr:hypothetical protein [Balneolaceae bacterium]
MAKRGSHKGSSETGSTLQKGFNPLPWTAVALLILAGAVIAGVYWNRTATIKEIRFSGNYFVETEQLKDRVEIPLGVRPDSIDFMVVINKIERISYVKWASIEMEPGGRLIVKITERQPIALLADGKNKTYVDAEGIRLALKPGKAVNVPIVYGFGVDTKSDTLASEEFMNVLDFLVSVKKNPVCDATISEVTWTDEKGIVALSHAGEVNLIFGYGEYPTRLKNWEAFYGEVVRTKGLDRMQWVDLRFRNQIVTREI